MTKSPCMSILALSEETVMPCAGHTASQHPRGLSSTNNPDCELTRCSQSTGSDPVYSKSSVVMKEALLHVTLPAGLRL